MSFCIWRLLLLLLVLVQREEHLLNLLESLGHVARLWLQNLVLRLWMWQDRSWRHRSTRLKNWLEQVVSREVWNLGGAWTSTAAARVSTRWCWSCLPREGILARRWRAEISFWGWFLVKESVVFAIDAPELLRRPILNIICPILSILEWHLWSISAGCPWVRFPIGLWPSPSFSSCLRLAECFELLPDDSLWWLFDRTSFVFFVWWLLLLTFWFSNAWRFTWRFHNSCMWIKQRWTRICEVDVDQLKLRWWWFDLLVEILDDTWLQPEGWVRCWVHAAIRLPTEWFSGLAVLLFRLVMWSPTHLVGIWIEIWGHGQIKASLIWIKHIDFVIELLTIDWVHEKTRHLGVIKSRWALLLTFIPSISIQSHFFSFVFRWTRYHHRFRKIAILFLDGELLRLRWCLHGIEWVWSLFSIVFLMDSFNWCSCSLCNFRYSLWLIIFVRIIRYLSVLSELFQGRYLFRALWFSILSIKLRTVVFCKHWAGHRDLIVLIAVVESTSFDGCVVIWTFCYTFGTNVIINCTFWFILVQFLLDITLIWISYHFREPFAFFFSLLFWLLCRAIQISLVNFDRRILLWRDDWQHISRPWRFSINRASQPRYFWHKCLISWFLPCQGILNNRWLIWTLHHRSFHRLIIVSRYWSRLFHLRILLHRISFLMHDWRLVISTRSVRWLFKILALLKFLQQYWFLVVIHHRSWVWVLSQVISFDSLIFFYFIFFFGCFGWNLFFWGFVVAIDYYLLIFEYRIWNIAFELSYRRNCWFLIWRRDFGVLGYWFFETFDFEIAVLCFTVFERPSDGDSRLVLNLLRIQYSFIDSIRPSINRVAKRHHSRSFRLSDTFSRLVYWRFGRIGVLHLINLILHLHPSIFWVEDLWFYLFGILSVSHSFRRWGSHAPVVFGRRALRLTVIFTTSWRLAFHVGGE